MISHSATTSPSVLHAMLEKSLSKLQKDVLLTSVFRLPGPRVLFHHAVSAADA